MIETILGTGIGLGIAFLFAWIGVRIVFRPRSGTPSDLWPSTEFWKTTLAATALCIFIFIFYYAQEVRHYRYVQHEAAMDLIQDTVNRGIPCSDP